MSDRKSASRMKFTGGPAGLVLGPCQSWSQWRSRTPCTGIRKGSPLEVRVATALGSAWPAGTLGSRAGRPEMTCTDPVAEDSAAAWAVARQQAGRDGYEGGRATR